MMKQILTDVDFSSHERFSVVVVCSMSRKTPETILLVVKLIWSFAWICKIHTSAYRYRLLTSQEI